MIAALLAIFVLTFTVAVLVIATMGETTLSFDQMRAQQALGIAEAGAFRALAELRRRLHVDLDARVRAIPASDRTLWSLCGGLDGRAPIEIVTGYAQPEDAPPGEAGIAWTLDAGTAVLSLGSPTARIQVMDRPTGRPVGTFYAVIAVRESGGPRQCRFGGDPPEIGVVWFDYAVVSVGRVGNAARAVCLRSPNADRCAVWFPRVTAAWRGSFGLTGGASAGWPVLIERNTTTYAAPRYPAPFPAFAEGDPLYDRSQWEEMVAP
jgi:hypothetical protein